MDLDPFILSRIQFALTMTFHIMFPMITISLGWILVFFKLRYVVTKDEAWMESYFFFTKVFAMSFALGVVSGITMSFQFGTNWPGFMEVAGNIAGPLLAFEVFTAFFIEASFLAIMLFGFRRVKGWVHTLATVLVAFATTMSAFWILALDSWMQTPDGFKVVDGVVYATDWWKVIFNPSMPYRFFHTLLASGLTSSFIIAGVCGLRYFAFKDRKPATMKTMKFAVYLSAILIPLQILAGDIQGWNTKEYQPAKLAAIESLWETTKGAPLILFALPNEEKKRNDFEIAIPKISSLILTHDINGEIKGLNDFEHIPPVGPVFWSFKVMLGMGMLMFLVAWSGVFVLWKRRQWIKYLALALIPMSFSGWVATIAGWYVTEIGRQPFMIYNVLTVKDSLGNVSGASVLSSLIAFIIVYGILLFTYIGAVVFLAKKASGKVKDERLVEKPLNDMIVEKS